MMTHERKANLLSNFSSPKCPAQFLKGSNYPLYTFSQNEVNFCILEKFVIHGKIQSVSSGA